MSPEMLCKHFDRIADTPDAVPRLRKFILDLAVRGKLVEQNPEDEPAEALIEKICTTQKNRFKSYPIDHNANSVEFDRAIPFPLPNGWSWARLGSIADKLTDGSHNPPLNTENGFPMLSSQNVLDGSISFSNPSRYLSESDFRSENQRTIISPGDILLTIVATIGRSAVVPDNAPKFAIQRSVAVIRTQLNSEFLAIQLRSPYAFSYYDEHGKGTAQRGIYLKKLSMMPVVIPPLAEQRRIVLKVDELMKLCDELESANTKRERRRDRLVAATLHGMNNGDTLLEAKEKFSFEESARFYFNQFSRLTARNEHIQQLRQTILNLAVRGKLVPQDPEDEPALELFTRLRAEKERLIDKEKIKKEKLLTRITVEEQPFEIPQHWSWFRWGDIALKIGDIDHKMPDTAKNGIPYVSPRDFLPHNEIDFEGAKRVSVDDFDRLSAKIKPEVGDLIYPRYGTIGENRLVEVQRDFLVSYSCAVIKILLDFVNPKYQYVFSISDLARNQAKASENKATQPNVGINSIKEFLFPLPPLAEQHRIATKVDELMTLCDELEAVITTTATTRHQLLEATLHDAI